MSSAPQSGGEGITVRYSRFLSVFGATCGIGSPAAAIWLAYSDPRLSREPAWPLILMGLVFGAMGAWLLLVGERVWARFTEEGIEAQRAFGRIDRVAWKRITSVRYSFLRRTLEFYGRGGEQVRVPVTDSLSSAAPVIARHLRPALYEKALALALRIASST